jgi:hypothetical protein
VTLRDAADHITKLPKAEQQLDEWQTAIEALIMAAESRGPLMHARIGMLRALNRHLVRTFTSLTPNRHSLAPRLSLFGHRLSGLFKQLGWHIISLRPVSWEYNLCRDSFFIST